MSTIACRPLYIGNQTIGDRYDKNGVFAFFGNRHFPETEMDRCFPDYQRSQLKQIHSNHVIETELPIKGTQEGDAQISSEPLIALTVYTADCLPVLIYDQSQRKVAAIHAGWKGIESQIIVHTLNKMSFNNPADIFVWIGPHIHQNSFEVGSDVASRLESIAGTTSVSKIHPLNKDKRFVSLEQIARIQLQSANVLPENTWIHSTDTLTHQEYFSYRRDGKGGRLLSFICLTE